MAEGRLPKPELRNLHMNYTRKSIYVILGITLLTGALYKFIISDDYERKVAAFYKTYDAEASLKRMKDAGQMQSYPETYRYSS